jgi:hypothetical protein
MKFSRYTGSITKLGYSAILLTTIYTIIITILGLKTMQMVKYIYDSTIKYNKH